MLKYDELAQLLNVSKSTLYALVADGKLPVVQFGNGAKTGVGCTRILDEDVYEFIRKHRGRLA